MQSEEQGNANVNVSDSTAAAVISVIVPTEIPPRKRILMPRQSEDGLAIKDSRGRIYVRPFVGGPLRRIK
jgi:hypothetical protein